MYRDNRQMMCILLAVLAPLAHYSGAGYMTVLLAAGAMLPLTILAGDGLQRISKAEAALELLWLGIVMGKLMGVSGANWPGNKAEIVVPLAILMLGIITGNGEKSRRVCCTLFWIAVIPVLLIVGTMISKIEPTWLKPEPGTWSAGLIATLLYPSLIGVKEADRIRTGIAIGLLAGTLAVLVQGGLSVRTAGWESSPLYELGRCIGNGGFEIIVSIVLTLSWYGFVSFGMNAAESFGEKLGLTAIQSRIGTGVVTAGAVIAPIGVKDWMMISGCMILWVLVPLLHPKK